MPVTGLPRILEHTLNNILEDFNLVSYKIAGSEPRTTLVLRFDARMADASVSPIHQSTPQSCYRRKPPSQLKRDRKRQEQHLKLPTEKNVHQNSSLTKKNEIAAMHSIQPQADRDDSALHSLSVLDRPGSIARSTRLETAHSEQERCPNNPLYFSTSEKKETESQHDTEEQRLFDSTLRSSKQTTEKEERKLKHNQHTGLASSQDYHDTDTVSEHSSDNTGAPYSNTPKRGIPDSQDADNSEQSTASETSNADNSEQKYDSESEKSEIDEEAQTQRDKERTQNGMQQENQIPCDKVQLKICYMKKDTRQRVTQPERKNSLRKIVLDAYDCQYVMVAETDDLIVEYCMRKEAIINLCLKEEEESQYCRMRKRHLREWPDDTLRIKDEGHADAISEFQKQLTQLKSFITRY